MIDHRSFVRDRLRERSAALVEQLNQGGSDRAITLLSGEVKALTDLLVDFGAADVAEGHLILEAQRNRQDVLDAQAEARAERERGVDPDLLADLLPGYDEIVRANRRA